MKKTAYRSLAALLAGLGLILLAEFLGAFQGIDYYFYDLSFRVRGPQQRSNAVIIAAIDEKTLSKLGRWPLRRALYAQLLEKISFARAVGFTILWDEPSPDDAALAEAVRRYGRVVLPVYIDAALSPIFPRALFSPQGTGHIHVEQDIDGKVRKVFHTLYVNDLMLPSFASVLYETATGNVVTHQSLSSKIRRPAPRALYQLNPMRINYSGPPGSFQRLSFSDILEGNYPPSFFKDKIVLVGVTVPGIQTMFLTPFTEGRAGMSGVELHAHILNNLLMNNRIITMPELLRVLFALILFFLSFAFFMTAGERRAPRILLLILLGILFTVYFLFSHADFWIKPSLLYGSVLLPFGVVHLLKLDRAARMLDQGYARLVSHIGMRGRASRGPLPDQGLMGLFSPGGINRKIEITDSLTEQLLFEKALTDAVISSSVSGILLFEYRGTLVIVNDRARKLTAALSLELSSLDTFISSLMPHLVENSSSIGMLKRLSKPGETAAFTLSVPQKFYAKVDAVLIPFEKERYILFVITDITEIKKLEMHKDEMVSLISHELRTPLTAIQGYSHLLMLRADEKTGDFAKIINAEAQRMTRLIATYLDLSHLESGERLIQKSPINVIEMINEVVDIAKPLISEKDMTIRIDAPDAVPPLMADNDLMRQCILNLVENAVKYSPERREIVISVWQQKGMLNISVIDQGYGMEQEVIEKIFDKFYRATAVTAKETRGHGLGLSFVKYAVELQGGTIMVESEPGRGSTFTISFPW